MKKGREISVTLVGYFSHKRLRTRKEMILKNEYFGLNRILLLAIGLWPFQQSNLTRFQFIFMSTILTMYVIFQCTIFVSQKCTPELVTKVLSSVFFFALLTIKYNMFYFNLETLKDMLEQLLHTCNKLRDPNELAIINEYGCNGKRYTVALTILAICTISVLIVLSFWSDICNVILPRNASRSHQLLIVTEYFINQEKYFYLILLHSIVSFCIGMTALLAIGTMHITYLQLTCGMFKIASYRIERAMSINMLRNINLRKNIWIFRGLIYAVDIHRQAMKLTALLISSIQAMLFFLIVFGVVSLSLNLFRIASSEEDIKESLVSFSFTNALVLCMFVANYIGQDVMNHNHHVFVTAYNVRWYIAPLFIQRMTLLLLQRRSKNFTLNVGGLFDASVEGFATLLKASVSYFTFIYSTQ